MLLFLWNDLSSFRNSQVENRNSDLKDIFGNNMENMHSKGGGTEYHGNMTGFNFSDCSDICDNFLYLLTTEGSRKRNLESLALLLVGKKVTATNIYF